MPGQPEENLTMKVRIGTALCVALCLGAGLATPQAGKFTSGQEQSPVTEEINTAAQAVATSGCNGELWNHVYRRGRLHIVHACIAVTGTIKHVKREADGDDHIQLAVDPEFSKLLNAKNRSAQGDTLIIETICQGPAFQADAHAACHGFHSSVDIFPAGTKVRVVGSYVLDMAQGWMEIHP